MKNILSEAHPIGSDSSRKGKPRRALVLCKSTPYKGFQQDLFETLHHLNCYSSIFTKWPGAHQELKEFANEYDLLVVDPTVNSFSSERFRQVIEQATLLKDIKVVLATGQDGLDLSSLEEKLNAVANITPDCSAYGMAFILKGKALDLEAEKRKYPRVLTNIPVEYSSNREEDPKLGEALNVSTGGLFVRSLPPEARRTFLNLQFDLQDSFAPIECSGRVVHSFVGPQDLQKFSPSGMGIQFKGMNIEDRERLEYFVFNHTFRSGREDSKE